MIKIKKTKYLKASKFISKINKADIKKLDFSEFGEYTKEDIEDFITTGLCNEDFITLLRSNTKYGN